MSSQASLPEQHSSLSALTLTYLLKTHKNLASDSFLSFKPIAQCLSYLTLSTSMSNSPKSLLPHETPQILLEFAASLWAQWFGLEQFCGSTTLPWFSISKFVLQTQACLPSSISQSIIQLYCLRRDFYTFSTRCLPKAHVLYLKIKNKKTQKTPWELPCPQDQFHAPRNSASQSASKLPSQSRSQLCLSFYSTLVSPSSNDQHFLHSSLKNEYKLSLCTWFLLPCCFSVTQNPTQVWLPSFTLYYRPHSINPQCLFITLKYFLQLSLYQ